MKITKIGCHVSIAGGLWNAPGNAAQWKCETFQIFSRSPHGGPVKEIDSDTITKFNAEMKKYGYTTFVIHAPYFLNLGSSNNRIFHGTLAVLRQELERGSLLGAAYVMFHPGSFKDLGEEKGMEQARAGLKKVFEGYTGKTKLLVEISAGAGQVIGDTFEEIATLIKDVKKEKGFGGICFDTQHAFGSGYDLRTPDAVNKTMAQFDKAIGLKYLRMFHANDSKVEFGSHKDRHEHIGEGKIGVSGFKALLQFLGAQGLDLPLILETEHDKVEEDIALLQDIRNKVKVK